MSPELIKTLQEIEDRSADSPEPVRRMGVVVLTLMMAASEAIDSENLDVANEYMTAALEIGNAMRQIAKVQMAQKEQMERMRPGEFVA